MEIRPECLRVMDKCEFTFTTKYSGVSYENVFCVGSGAVSAGRCLFTRLSRGGPSVD